MGEAIDILILSNGPGELATWVKPVVRSLRRRLGEDRQQVRISVVLSPCANASGREAAIARQYPEVDRVQAAMHFFPFLITGKTHAGWDWHPRGVVLFLGGDQFFSVVIGKRLGYPIVVYAEWEARWHRWIDRCGVMNEQVLQSVAPEFAHKFAVVGDLMAEAGQVTGWDAGQLADTAQTSPLIGLLPGSKDFKLRLGVPLLLAIAERVKQRMPQVQFAIAVAPNLPLPTLAQFGNPQFNPVIQRFGWASTELITPSEPAEPPFIQTAWGLQVALWTEFPAYPLLTRCQLCLTTVGANTAELGALAVPMIVLLPTQQLDVMRAWDGLPGLLANLPGVGSTLAKGINWLALRRLGLLAWPNIWAKEAIVPELVGRLEPETVAARVVDYLEHPEKLDQMRDRLRQVRGEAGASDKLVQLVCEVLGQ